MLSKYKNLTKIILIILVILFLTLPLVKYILDEYFFEDVFVYILNHTDTDFNVEIIHSGNSMYIDAKKNDITNKTWTLRKKTSVYDYDFLVSIRLADDFRVYSRSIGFLDGAVYTAGAKGNLSIVIDVLKENGELVVYYSPEIFRYGDPKNLL